jgi:hypothetical protein
MQVRMQLPFSANDVRFVSIDGNTVRFDLQSGFVEVTFDSREAMARATSLQNPRPTHPARHVMYQDGIFGI